MAEEPLIPWPRIADFIRLHTHDIRNHLNGLDLEAALLREIVTDPKAVESVDRLRAQIRATAAELRELSAKLSDPQPNRAPLPARDLFLIWQDQAKALDIADKVIWSETLGDERVNVDATGVAKAMRELLVNASYFSNAAEMSGIANMMDGQVVFELHESKTAPLAPADWGKVPFHSTKRGGYGLGLWEADRLVRASGGEVEREVLPDGKLVTTLRFPLE